MPTHNGITFTLQSQYDALSIPEYPSATAVLNPCSSSRSSSEYADSVAEIPPTSPQLIEAYIPVYPSSQFWLTYQCHEWRRQCPEARFLYFKLFMQGRCILSWGVGKEEEWQGKTMFGLFDAGSDFEGRRVVERRGFFFGKTCEDGQFEIRVFRAKARRREKTVCEMFDDGAGGGALR
jgi:hypothetical protein